MDKGGKAVYSISELAEILKTGPDHLAKFVSGEFSETTELNGVKFIAEKDLVKFFNAYVAFHKISPDSYEIPDYLADLSYPWAATLAGMYRERFAYPSSVSPNQGQLLKDIVCNLNPGLILEIGCFIGISTIWMASGLEQIKSQGVIHSVDLFNTIMPWPPHSYGYLQNPFEYAQKSASSARLSHRIKFHKMDSNELGERFAEIINRPIDFLFIDGDHTIHGCVNDFVLFYPHVSIGGYIMLHDIYPEQCGWDGPRYIIDNFVKKSPHFSLIEIDTSPHNFGMALIRKLSEDNSLHPGRNLSLEMQRGRAKLAKTPLWRKIRRTSLGKLIKRLLL